MPCRRAAEFAWLRSTQRLLSAPVRKVLPPAGRRNPPAQSPSPRQDGKAMRPPPRQRGLQARSEPAPGPKSRSSISVAFGGSERPEDSPLQPAGAIYRIPDQLAAVRRGCESEVQRHSPKPWPALLRRQPMTNAGGCVTQNWWNAHPQQAAVANPAGPGGGQERFRTGQRRTTTESTQTAQCEDRNEAIPAVELCRETLSLIAVMSKTRQD